MNNVIKQKIKEFSKNTPITESDSDFKIRLFYFLESTLRTHTEQLKERVEGLRMNGIPQDEGGLLVKNTYNQTLTDVLAILSEDK